MLPPGAVDDQLGGQAGGSRRAVLKSSMKASFGRPLVSLPHAAGLSTLKSGNFCRGAQFMLYLRQAALGWVVGVGEAYGGVKGLPIQHLGRLGIAH